MSCSQILSMFFCLQSLNVPVKNIIKSWNQSMAPEDFHHCSTGSLLIRTKVWHSSCVSWCNSSGFSFGFPTGFDKWMLLVDLSYCGATATKLEDADFWLCVVEVCMFLLFPENLKGLSTCSGCPFSSHKPGNPKRNGRVFLFFSDGSFGETKQAIKRMCIAMEPSKYDNVRDTDVN